jgi:glyoxylase-like metal-dependent hydrolase (beta-lactamase superfamily II)
MKIHTLDTHFQGMAQVTAVYLLIGPDGPALVETGPGSTIPAVVDALAAHGYQPGDIGQVLLTHIHLDHAGAAGWWAQQGAHIYVHRVGAPHLIDPSRLMASAGRIYGDLMEPLWGEMLPVPEERLTALDDGDVVQAGGLAVTALDTPGHAYHHHTYVLETDEGRLAFTGDAGGINLPQVNIVDLPAPPPEFHLETWLATLDRLAAQNLALLYPTHYGLVMDAAAQIATLRALMIEAVEFITGHVRDQMGGAPGDPFPATIDASARSALLEEYVAWNRRRAAAGGLSPEAIRRYELANPLFMSVDGILRYLRKRETG